MEKEKDMKNTTKKITNENINRRSNKYIEVKEDKEEDVLPIIKFDKKKNEEKEENIEKKEKKTDSLKDKISKAVKKDKVKRNEHKKIERKDYQIKKNDDSISKKKKKIKLDTNNLIFFGVLFFVAALIFLKTMGALMCIITLIGIFAIIGISIFLKKLRKNKVARIITNIFTIVFLLGCIAGVCGVGYFAYVIVSEAPQWNPKQLSVSETTLVYDQNGTLYAELGTEKRDIIDYDEASENLINAIIAVEDSRFFQHNGFDPLRFFKAGIGQVFGQSDAGGASTLSMQVIKNHFTDANMATMNSEGIKRKFTDIYLAVFKLEKEYSKERILELYMNNHFLGSNSYGVEQAADTYFGKEAYELNLSEAALIAGMFQAPTAYNPFLYPENAAERRSDVLYLMYVHGYITKEEMDIANSIPVESLLKETESKEVMQYQSYIDTVIDELRDKYGLSPYTTSLQIYTNIDLEKQAGLDAIFKGETFKWENDVVQSGIAAVDVWTGKITAIAGGRNTNKARQYNRATQMNRQIGSTAKPIFDYGPAMEYLGWSTYTIIKDEKYYYSNGQEMRNSDRKHMGNMTLKDALAQSRNVPALKAFQSVDKDDIYEFVTGLGITPEGKGSGLHEAHSIGSFNGSNPLEMAAAYAAFANGGTYYEPYTISKIVYRDSGETFEVKPKGTRVMSEATAYMMAYSLRYTVTDGIAKGASVAGITLAAKTGTTNFTNEIAATYNLPSTAVNDAWIVGFDPDTAVGMWYGYDNIIKQESNKKTCSTEAYFLKSLSSGCKINVQTERNGLYKAAIKVLMTSDKTEFEMPDDVVKVAIEKGTNPAKLATSATPKNKITYEYFKKGTEPTEFSTKYIQLKNVSNLTAKYDFVTTNVNLSWSAAAPIADFDETYGRFGYKIYLNNVYLGFTEDTNYIVTNSNNLGTYKIVTTYEDYSGTDSTGATVTIGESDTDSSTYSSSENFQTHYSIGETPNSCLINGNPENTCVSLYKDGIQVNDGYTTTFKITNLSGEETSIDTTNPGTYNLTIKITYNGKVRVSKVLVISIN